MKKYELNNLLFFLTLIAALTILVAYVFHHYGTRNQGPQAEAEMGVVSESLSEGSDVGLFYLGTQLSATNLQYRSRLEIPSTDDGLVRELFALPGIEEVTINQTNIMLKKVTSARWESIQPGVRRIVKNHLHLHY